MRAGEQVVERQAERVNVGALVDILRRQNLLGRHISRRANRLLCQRLQVAARRVGAKDVGQAEVEQDNAIRLFFDHRVRRLDVAMDNALTVRIGERVGHTSRRPQRLLLGHPAARQAFAMLVERLAVDVLQRQIDRLPTLGNSGVFIGQENIVDQDDAGMPERRDRPRLTRDASKQLMRVRADLNDIFARRHHLKSDETMQAFVAGKHDLRHAALPQFLQDFIFIQEF